MDRYGDSRTTAIINLSLRNPVIANWWDPRDDGTLGFYRTFVMTRDNRAALASIYGPRAQSFTGEFRHDVWRVEQGDLAFWLLSSGGKGTSIEVEIDPKAVSERQAKGVVDFLDGLFRRLHAYEPGFKPKGWEPPDDAVRIDEGDSTLEP